MGVKQNLTSLFVEDGGVAAALRIMGDNADDWEEDTLGVNQPLIWLNALCKSSLAVKLKIVLADF